MYCIRTHAPKYIFQFAHLFFVANAIEMLALSSPAPVEKKSFSCCLSHQNPTTYLFRAVLVCAWSVQISLLIQTRSFFHWSRGYCGLWTWFKVKNIFCFNICFFWLHKMLTDGLEWCGLLVDYCDVFSSFLDSHSDGTHSLQSTLVMLWCISPSLFWWRNKLLYGLKMSKGFSKLKFLWAIALNLACMFFSSSGTDQQSEFFLLSCDQIQLLHNSCVTLAEILVSSQQIFFFLWRLCMYFFVVKHDQPLTQFVCMLNKQKRGRARTQYYLQCCE